MKKLIKWIFAKFGYEVVAASYFDLLKSQADENNNLQQKDKSSSDEISKEQTYAFLEDTASSPDSNAAFFNQVVDKILKANHESIFWGDRMLTLDKSMGFWQDEKFKMAFDSIKDSHKYDQYGGNDTVAWRIYILVWAAIHALNLGGDFVECGVFKGDFSWVITQATDFLKSKKKFYLYDSFKGLSDKYSSPNDFPENPDYWEVAKKAYDVPGIYKSVCERFAEMQQVKIAKGLLPDTLKDDSPEKISFLHIDLNSPKAEIGVLDALFDRVVSGGIIIFDDYGWKIFHKQKEAEDKFMSKRGYDILELPTGQGMMIKGNNS